MKKISKFAQSFVVILVLIITFVNFGTDFDNTNKTSFPIQEKGSLPILFDKTRIAKAAAATASTFFLEMIIFGLIQGNQDTIYPNQTLSVLTLIPFGCYLAADYLFDKFTKPLETKEGQH